MKGAAVNMDDSDAIGGKKAKVEMKKPLITMPNTPSFIRYIIYIYIYLYIVMAGNLHASEIVG